MNIFQRFKARQRYHYAKIDEHNRCVSVWRFSYPVDRPDAVAIGSMDYYLIGRTWDGSHWSAEEQSVTNAAQEVAPSASQSRAA